MFLRFRPLAPIRGLERRAVQHGRSTRQGRRSPDRARTRAQFRLEGLEERCLLSGIAALTSFPTPTQGSGSTWGITTGPDGNLWFTETGASKIGMINPTTHAISEFATPTASASPEGITAGPDRNLWFTENGANKIGMINPTTHAISEFATPTRNSGPQEITAGPDGNLWFTENGANKIGMINPTTHAITEFRVPTSGSGPDGIAAGLDGNLWFTEAYAGKIGEINPTTHAITEFTVPGDPELTDIAKGPDGNLWFGHPYSIVKFNPTTHVFTQFPTTNGPIGVTAGPDGDVWFTEDFALVPQLIASINPTTGAITEYPVNAPSTGVHHVWEITMGPDGNLWLTESRGQSAIGVATLNSSELVVTQQPPASVTAGSPFGLTVEAEDSAGNPITSFNGTVTVALPSYIGATLGGTLTVTASNGVATFSGLTLTRASSGYTLDTSGGGFGSGVTNAFSVTAAPATQLVIAQQPPATVTPGTGFGLQASIEDQYGNVVTTAANTVSMAFANNRTGATLGGTLSVTASQGLATFSGLTINLVGSGYTIQVSSNGLSGAVSSAISVTKTKKAGSASLVVSDSSAVTGRAGTNSPDPLLAPLVLDSPGFLDSLGLKKRGRTT